MERKLFRIIVVFVSLVMTLTGFSAYASCPTADLCVTTTADNFSGSLRQAIIDANANPDLNTIEFDIPGSGNQVITLFSVLPPITESVVMDATTQTGDVGGVTVIGHPSLNVQGYKMFHLKADDSVIKGFNLQRMGDWEFFTTNRSGMIFIEDGDNNQILDNRVNTSADGTAVELGVTTWFSEGIVIFDGSDENLIEGNLVSGSLYGVLLWGDVHDNVIRNNILGPDVTGTQLMPSSFFGGITGNVFGMGGFVQTVDDTSTLVANNVISGNALSGTEIDINGFTLVGNLVGTDKWGLAPLGNGSNGILMRNSSGHVIGGVLEEQRNIIADNGGVGVHLFGVDDTSVVGNFIGINKVGAPMGNDVGLAAHSVGGSMPTTAIRVGGPSLGEGNVIAHNTWEGVFLRNFEDIEITANTIDENGGDGLFLWGGRGMTVSGNRIRWNGYGGIGIFAATHSGAPLTVRDVTIGGEDPGSGNSIASNQDEGIWLASLLGDPDGIESVSILGNSIDSNGLGDVFPLGINLSEPAGSPDPTVNDPLDLDDGVNNIQNYPVIKEAKWTERKLKVKGEIPSEANKRYRIEVFLSDEADTTGFGEGQTFVGYVNAETNAQGEHNWKVEVSCPRPPDDSVVTATATEIVAGGEDDDDLVTYGSTSEFSRAMRVSIQNDSGD